MSGSAFPVSVNSLACSCFLSYLPCPHARQGWIGGAILDVFTTEPLSQDSPLWSLPTVMAALINILSSQVHAAVFSLHRSPSLLTVLLPASPLKCSYLVELVMTALYTLCHTLQVVNEFVDNLRSFLLGEQLRNQVDFSKGY